MNMKITVYHVFVLTGILVLFSSCFSFGTTIKRVLDDRVSPDQSVVVTFKGGGDRMFIIHEWNGIAVYNNLYPNDIVYSNNPVVLTIPAGNNSFLFTFQITFSNRYSSYTYRLEDISLKHDFEAGKKYEITGAAKLLGLIKGYDLSYRIHDVTNKKELVAEVSLGITSEIAKQQYERQRQERQQQQQQRQQR